LDGPRLPSRSEPAEIVELRRLRASQPELTTAVDLQIALFNVQRRVRARLPVPWFDVDAEWWRKEQEEGRPFLRLTELNIDWTEFRLLFRQTTDALRQYEQIEDADYAELQTLVRGVDALQPLVEAWYRSAPGQVRVHGPGEVPPAIAAVAARSTMLQTVVMLSMRPFLSRMAEIVGRRCDLSGWRAPYCPCCGGEPDLAFITPAADRRLICERCQGQWTFDQIACPFCSNDDRARITSFATRDGQYRIYACDVCKRYLKAFDGRQSSRPVLPVVDEIATLPLDAAAVQKGYVGSAGEPRPY
jgi:hypothetical protein